MQCFDYQFRALGRIVDEHNMDPATVDQAEAMIKALESINSMMWIWKRLLLIDIRTISVIHCNTGLYVYLLQKIGTKKEKERKKKSNQKR